MEIEQIARMVAAVSIYSEQSVLDFFDERNHHDQATVGIVIAEVLLSQLDATEVRLTTQSRLAINCCRGKVSLEDAYQRLREASGLGDCDRYLAKASHLARTLALLDGVVLTRLDLWNSTAPNDVKYWGIATVAMEHITGIPMHKMIIDSGQSTLT